LKAGARLAQLDPERRHKMRLQAKKLRYASEFFAGVFQGKKAARRREAFVAGLEKLQDALGDLNDIARACGLTERIMHAQDARGKQRPVRAKKPSPPVAFPAGRKLASPTCSRTRSAPTVPLTKAKPFWS
jgi:CHAD domain-containing protein